MGMTSRSNFELDAGEEGQKEGELFVSNHIIMLAWLLFN